MRIEKINTAFCHGGESPLWDETEQALYFIDNSGQKVHRYTPADDETVSWEVPEVVTALALRDRGGAVVALKSGLYFLNFDTNELEGVFLLPQPRPFVFNDGKVDRRGRFLIGASTPHIMNPTNDGGLYQLGSDLTLRRLDTGIHFSNGPCWSPDNNTFYFSDSWIKTVYAYDYHMETGDVFNRRTFVDTDHLGGIPDGATVDVEGNYWVALYGPGKVAGYSSSGNLEQLIDMPVKLVSSVMFGGPDLDRLYVTTIARRHDQPDAHPEVGAGQLYVIEDIGARGLPEPRYQG